MAAVLVAILASLVLAAGPARAAPPPNGAVAVARRGTPLLSVRRDPAWIDDTLAHQRLQRTLSGPVAGLVPGSRAAKGCVLAVQDGAALFELNQTGELLPASNLKLITATAALSELGPDYRFTTTVDATGRRVGGALAGNLYLVGGGDPDLMTAAYDSTFHFPEPVYTSLDRLAAAVRAAGITRITGSVIGDASRYDDQIGIPSWSPVYRAEGDVGPLSALEVNDGSPPPARPGLGGGVGHADGVDPAEVGEVGPVDPARLAAQTFTDALEAAGVQVGGPARAGRAPLGTARLTETESAPLATLVEQMIRVSDDTAAELLTKELGYHRSGLGTSAAGLAVVRQAAAAAGLPVGQLLNLDGSGLDRGDRVTCSLMVATLEHAGVSGVLAAGLPIAGRTGTLTDRMVGTVAAGRLHAKTGTLSDVAALSGFVMPAPGAPTPELAQPVFFSIIINGMDSAQGAPLLDRLGVALAGYPDGVALHLLEPEG